MCHVKSGKIVGGTKIQRIIETYIIIIQQQTSHTQKWNYYA